MNYSIHIFNFFLENLSTDVRAFRIMICNFFGSSLEFKKANRNINES